MGMWYDGGAWWAMGIGMLLWIVLLAAAVGLVVWLVNRASGGQRAGRGDAAEALLRQRFASGEIDSDEYEKRLALLRR